MTYRRFNIGTVWIGLNGQVREIVAIHVHNLQYRLLKAGTKPGTTLVVEGGTSWMSRRKFQRWAISEHNEAAGGTAALQLQPSI